VHLHLHRSRRRSHPQGVKRLRPQPTAPRQPNLPNITLQNPNALPVHIIPINNIKQLLDPIAQPIHNTTITTPNRSRTSTASTYTCQTSSSTYFTRRTRNTFSYWTSSRSYLTRRTRSTFSYWTSSRSYLTRRTRSTYTCQTSSSTNFTRRTRSTFSYWTSSSSYPPRRTRNTFSY